MDLPAIINELVNSRLFTVGLALAVVGVVQLAAPTLVNPVTLILSALVAGFSRAAAAATQG